jgi:hypothetical protein
VPVEDMPVVLLVLLIGYLHNHRLRPLTPPRHSPLTVIRQQPIFLTTFSFIFIRLVPCLITHRRVVQSVSCGCARVRGLGVVDALGFQPVA